MAGPRKLTHDKEGMSTKDQEFKKQIETILIEIGRLKVSVSSIPLPLSS